MFLCNFTHLNNLKKILEYTHFFLQKREICFSEVTSLVHKNKNKK